MNSNKGVKSGRARNGTAGGRGPGSVRIIAGEHRGRRIEIEVRPGLRPTPDRVREALFNWLGQWLDGAACLDLYAGTGALGFEAASRGAARVVVVDNDRRAFEALQKTKDLLRARRVEAVFSDAMDYLAKSEGFFDVVFLDPPFGQNALPAVLERLPARLAPQARVYVEAEVPLAVSSPWEELKGARAGQVSYQLLQWKGDGKR